MGFSLPKLDKPGEDKKACCSSEKSDYTVTAMIAGAVTLGVVAAGFGVKFGMEYMEGRDTEVTLAMIKPDAVEAGTTKDILKVVKANGFKVVKQKEYQLSREQAEEFYAEHKGRPFFEGLITFMTSGPIVALALQRVGAIKAWRALMGPTATDKAKADAPESLRALFGTDNTKNATHGSDSPASAARELAFHFPEYETTLAMIKPDAVRAEVVSEIKSKIKEAGFTIVAEKEYQLSDEQASAFYAEHAQRPFFPTLKEFMTSGPIVALALRKEDAVKSWRALMGPTNTDTAKKDAPESLRALFGTDATQNATHGSDSFESAARELYFHFPPVETTLAMIKPDAVAAGSEKEIMAKIKAAGFKIVKCKKTTLTSEQVDEFYAEHVGKSFFSSLKEFMTSGPIYALALRKRDAIKAWRSLMGPTNTATAKSEAPDSLRALFGTDNTKNATHGSDSHESAAKELAFHFPNAVKWNRFWGFGWF